MAMQKIASYQDVTVDILVSGLLPPDVCKPFKVFRISLVDCLHGVNPPDKFIPVMAIDNALHYLLKGTDIWSYFYLNVYVDDNRDVYDTPQDAISAVVNYYSNYIDEIGVI